MISVGGKALVHFRLLFHLALYHGCFALSTHFYKIIKKFFHTSQSVPTAAPQSFLCPKTAIFPTTLLIIVPIWYNSIDNRVTGWFWPLFYIGWGWCWWNILTLRISWPLECSFWHYWHSFLRLSDSVSGIEKPPQNFGWVRGGIS